MKRLFTTPITATWASLWLLVLRVTASGAMLVHGWPKLKMLLDGHGAQFPDPMGAGPLPSLVLAVLAEVGCSLLLIVGLASRLAAVPLAITMAVAAFIVHASDPFAKHELPVLYLLVYGTIVVFGPGRFSLDAVLGRGK